MRVGGLVLLVRRCTRTFDWLVIFCLSCFVHIFLAFNVPTWDVVEFGGVFLLHAFSRVRGDSKLFAFFIFYFIPSVSSDRLNNHTV